MNEWARLRARRDHNTCPGLLETLLVLVLTVLEKQRPLITLQEFTWLRFLPNLSSLFTADININRIIDCTVPEFYTYFHKDDPILQVKKLRMRKVKDISPGTHG